MIEHVAIVVLTGLFVLLASIGIGKWLFKEDEKGAARRKKIGRFATIFEKRGLPVHAAIALDVSAGAVIDAWTTFEHFMESALHDEAALTKELDAVFETQFDAKASTPDGLAWIKAKLAAVPSA